MKTASVADVKARIDAYVKASAAGPVVVTRNGKAVAVLLGVHDDEELERLLLAHSRKLHAILDAADRRIDEGAGIPHDKFWKQVESASRSPEGHGSAKKRRAKAILESSRKQIREGDVLSHEEFWKEVKASRVPKRNGRKHKRP